MFRSMLTAAILLSCPLLADAQRPFGPAAGRGGFGGGVRPNFPGVGAPAPLMSPRYNFRGGFGGGFVPQFYGGPGYPFSGVWGSYGLYGGNYYAYPYPVPYAVEVPVEVAPEPSGPPPIILANEFPATLILEFPAAAEVWVNGKKEAGEPATEWTLTSPVLQPGGKYTFEVKARWKSGGTTFGYERAITVAAGGRSRSSIVAGTPVKE